MMSRSAFLTANWRYLAMLNYEIDPAVLHPRVPPGTELDLFQGRALLTIFGCLFEDVRVWGMSIPFHRKFEVLHTRFYVRRETPQGCRRGIVAIREVIPRWAAASVARWIMGENYITHSMRHLVQPPNDDSERVSAKYEWRERGHWNRLQVDASGTATLPTAGSEQEFVVERYWGYSRRPQGASEIPVEHPPWKIWQSSEASLDCDPLSIYGPEFVDALRGPCSSALLAVGSASKVYPRVSLSA